MYPTEIIIDPTLWKGWDTIEIVHSGDDPDSNKKPPSDIEWKPAFLVIYDSTCGGSRCSAPIQYGQKDNTHTFLKSVEPLDHTDFGDLFRFSPDNFIKGRIIRVLSIHIEI